MYIDCGQLFSILLLGENVSSPSASFSNTLARNSFKTLVLKLYLFVYCYDSLTS